ncbi:sigma-70 family RNA polymerase sigma factor [Aliiglaciecola sp. NS0011-25]|uniref:sigma-70 family RNA polymerase sigma factor n=1 Tax=Aliiglaciecola sp. NS0011-25 TaxID=3127654 RepID=UPI00310859C3
MNQVVDEELLKRFADGDSASFELLYERHRGGLYRYMLRQLKDQQLAEDLFQDTWSKVIVNAESFEPNAKFSTWLYTMARNRVVDQIRHLRIVDKLIDDSTDEVDSQLGANQIEQNILEKTLQADKQSMFLKDCMQKLPVNLLEVFLLKEESTMTVKQIAEVIDSSHQATKSRLRYAYGQLKQCLSKKMPDWVSSGEGHE